MKSQEMLRQLTSVYEGQAERLQGDEQQTRELARKIFLMTMDMVATERGKRPLKEHFMNLKQAHA